MENQYVLFIFDINYFFLYRPGPPQRRYAKFCMRARGREAAAEEALQQAVGN